MWSSIISILLGLGQAGYSSYKKNQAQKKLDQMPSVNYAIPQGYADNLGLTAQQAETGFDPQSLETILNQYQQNFTASNSAILQGGGGFNDISKNYGVLTDAIAKVGVADSTLKNTKIENYLQASSTYAGQEALKWKLNKYDKDRNDRAAATALISGYNQSTNKGLNSAIQGGINLGSYFGSDSLKFDDGYEKPKIYIPEESNKPDPYGEKPPM